MAACRLRAVGYPTADVPPKVARLPRAVGCPMAAVRLMEASLHSAADRSRVGETVAVASLAVAAVAAALKAVAVVAGSTWEGG